MGPRTKVKDKFLDQKLRNKYNDIYLEDSNWKNSSMNYANALRDVDNNVVTVFLKKLVTIQETSCKMLLETNRQLVENSAAFEDSLKILRNGRDVSSGADDSEERF